MVNQDSQKSDDNLNELENYLYEDRELYLHIKDKLDGFGANYLSLFIVNPEKFTNTTKELVKVLCDDHSLNGIYLTVNKPYDTLISSFNERGIDVNKLLFIDCVSQKLNPAIELDGKYYFIESPSDLTQLEIYLQKAIADMPSGEIFIILDSISTLLVYHKKEIVEKFIHLLATKVRRKKDARGILIAVNSKEEGDFIDCISQFCDYSIRID